MLTTDFSVSGVSTPWRKRRSSSSTNTLTKRRSLPFSSKSRSPNPGWGVEGREHLADRGAVERELGGAADQAAQLGGDADGGHGQTSSETAGNAARNASSDGGMVAVTLTCGSIASSVFRP